MYIIINKHHYAHKLNKVNRVQLEQLAEGIKSYEVTGG